MMRHAAIRCHETSRGFDLLGLWGADDEIVVGAEHEMDDELTDLEVSTFDRSYLTDRSSGASVVLLPPYHITDREWRTPTAGAIKSGAIWMQMTPLFNFGQSRSLDFVGRLGSVTLSLLGPRTHSPDSFDHFDDGDGAQAEEEDDDDDAAAAAEGRPRPSEDARQASRV
jgi:hypothetical protein